MIRQVFVSYEHYTITFSNIKIIYSLICEFLVFEFSRDFMSSMPTKESADLDGSLVHTLSNSQNLYSFTYTQS